MLPGNPDFSGEIKAPAGMLPGNPDFFGEEKTLRACWQEIQTFLGGESGLGTTLTGREPAISQNPRLFGSGTNHFWN